MGSIFRYRFALVQSRTRDVFICGLNMLYLYTLLLGKTKMAGNPKTARHAGHVHFVSYAAIGRVSSKRLLSLLCHATHGARAMIAALVSSSLVKVFKYSMTDATNSLRMGLSASGTERLLFSTAELKPVAPSGVCVAPLAAVPVLAVVVPVVRVFLGDAAFRMPVARYACRRLVQSVKSVTLPFFDSRMYRRAVSGEMSLMFTFSQAVNFLGMVSLITRNDSPAVIAA